MRLLITLKLPEALVREMDVYRKKFNPQGISRIKSHITLVPPFELKGTLPHFVKNMRSGLAGMGNFSLRVGGLGSFGDEVIFFKPNCPRALKDLNATLRNLVGKNYREGKSDEYYWKYRTYHPHVTIAKGKPDYIREIRKSLKNVDKTWDCAVSGVKICAQRKDLRWILKKEILF